MKIFQNKKIIVFTLSFFCFFVFTPKTYAGILTKPANNLGLVGYWSFNEGTSTTATDFSGRRNHGTLNTFSAPATASSGWGNGKFGGGLNFDGSSDYVAISGVADDVVETSFAVSAWVKCSTNGDYTVWGTNNSTASQNKTGLFINPSGDFYIWDGSQEAQEITASVNACNGSWRHTVYTRTGSTGTLYVDGVSQGTHTAGDTFASNDLWAIGVEWEPGLTLSFYLNGSIDETRVFGRPLSQTDVLNLYNTGVTKINSSYGGVNTNGLVGWWTFDGGDFTDKVYDRSGQGNNGYVFSGATSTLKKLGKVGQGVYFNNSAPYINLGSPANLDNLNTKTITMWVSRAVLHQNQQVLVKNDSGGSGGWYIDLRGSVFGAGPNTVRYEHNWDASPSTFAIWYGSTLLNSTSTWYHIAVTYDKSSTSNAPQIYVNGVADTVTTGQAASGSSISDASSDLYIGAEGSLTEFHNGGVDDLRIYNRILSSSEIKQIYNSTAGSKVNTNQNTQLSTGLNSGLVGYWSFNGLDVTDKVYDRSGQGNDSYHVGRATSTVKTTGKVGQAFDFDGTTDYIRIGNPSSLNNLGPLTYSVWINPRTSGVSGRGHILAKTTADGSANGAILMSMSNLVSGGIYFFRVTTANAIARTTNALINFNAWNHVVVTWDGSVDTNNVHTYINGAEATYFDTSTASGSLDSDSSNPQVIGARPLTTPDRFFDGKIDEVRIYNKVLSASEIKQLYLMGR